MTASIAMLYPASGAAPSFLDPFQAIKDIQETLQRSINIRDVSEDALRFMQNRTRLIQEDIGAYPQRLVATSSIQTIISSYVLPVILVQANGANVGVLAGHDPMERSTADVAKEILRITGNNISNLAPDMFDVTRPTFYHWLNGRPMDAENERRLRQSLDILERAAQRRGVGAALSAWLETPVGPESITPMELLRTKAFDRARSFASSSRTQRRRTASDHLTTLPYVVETVAEGQARDWYERA
jgi:hypothetical protein